MFSHLVPFFRHGYYIQIAYVQVALTVTKRPAFCVVLRCPRPYRCFLVKKLAQISFFISFSVVTQRGESISDG